MSEILVIGVDGTGISQKHEELLRDCILIVASKRIASYLTDPPAEVVAITPLQEAFEKMEAALPSGKVGVLASGDPLLYGVGSRIIEHFGSERVRIYPALSSLQEAFSRFKMSWSDTTIVSLHGREKHHIPGLLLCRPKTFIFTDRAHSPDKIATVLRDYLDLIGDRKIRESLTFHVAENLGMEDEKITSGNLEEVAAGSFDNLNVVCLILPDLTPRSSFGLCEEEIAHSRGLITKDEVRAATLHRLRLPRTGAFWDIGGGSGSISIEAAAMYPQLTVYTVERKAEELANIKENIRRFNTFNVVPIGGKAAGLLHALPDPDAVFVGGSGGELEEIVAESARRLKTGGRLVINGVTEKTIAAAPGLMQKHGLTVETTTIDVQRVGPDGPVCFNPITIMVGRK